MRQRCGVFLLVLSLAIPVAGVAKSKDEDSKKPKDDVGAIGDRDVDGSLNFYSIEKEIALGKQMADEVQKTAKIVDDPVISEYVNRVGQNLVQGLTLGETVFEFVSLRAQFGVRQGLVGGLQGVNLLNDLGVFFHQSLIAAAE